MKRTPLEMERDCKKLKKAAQTATTIKELQEITGLSYFMIQTTLSKHPIIFKRIKEQLALNKEQAESKSQQKRALGQKSKIQQKEMNLSPSQQVEPNKSEKSFTRYVIDASICGSQNLRNRLSQICNSDAKIILTSITIKELKDMTYYKKKSAIDAKYILSLAVKTPHTFESVLIDETQDTPDNCIVKYCADNKNRVSLLTSDQEMVLNARMYSVDVHYLEKHNNSSHTSQPANSKIRTLMDATKIDNTLLISNFQTDRKSINVHSNGLVYSDGVQELKIGDDVFIATKKPRYITFAHYKMISLYEENNCELVYSKRFYDYSNLYVPKPEYKSFLETFMKAHNL